MSEIFLYYDKDSEEIRDLQKILSNSYFLNIKTKSDFSVDNNCDVYIEALKSYNLTIFCLTNSFVKSDDCMKVFDATKKLKKPFLFVKLEEIAFKNVKIVAVLFDDKKCFDLFKEREKRSNFRLIHNPRFQDFLKAISHHVDIANKYKDPKSTVKNTGNCVSSNKSFQNERSDNYFECLKRNLGDIVNNIDSALNQIKKANNDNFSSLEKTIIFIKNFVLKYLESMKKGITSECTESKDIVDCLKNSETNLIERLKEVEIQNKDLTDQLLETRNLNISLQEKMDEIQNQNSMLEIELQNIQLLNAEQLKELEMKSSNLTQTLLEAQDFNKKLNEKLEKLEYQNSLKDQLHLVKKSSKQFIETLKMDEAHLQIIQSGDGFKKINAEFITATVENFESCTESDKFTEPQEVVMKQEFIEDVNETVDFEEANLNIEKIELVDEATEAIMSQTEVDEEAKFFQPEEINSSQISLKSAVSSIYPKYNTIVSHRTFDLDTGLVARMVTLNGKDVFIVDNVEHMIKVIDIKGAKNGIVQTIQPKSVDGENLLEDPLNISAKSEDEIYITNYYSTSIFMFDKNFNLKTEIKNVIEDGNVIDFMDIDDLNPDIIYMVHNFYKKITVFNIKTVKKINEFESIEPWNIKAKNDKLFLVSLTFWEWLSKEKRHLKRLSKGANSIFVIDKNTLNLTETIKFDHWLRPEGFNIDEDNNILTTAFKFDKESSIVSEFRYVFIINKNYQLINEIELNQISWFADFIIFQNKFLFCGGEPKEKQWAKLIEIE